MCTVSMWNHAEKTLDQKPTQSREKDQRPDSIALSMYSVHTYSEQTGTGVWQQASPIFGGYYE